VSNAARSWGSARVGSGFAVFAISKLIVTMAGEAN